jgi:hypothetical protein
MIPKYGREKLRKSDHRTSLIAGNPAVEVHEARIISKSTKLLLVTLLGLQMTTV